jgi:hypothetical protein
VAGIKKLALLNYSFILRDWRENARGVKLS